MTEEEAFKELALNPDGVSMETIKVALRYIDKAMHSPKEATLQEQAQCHDTGSTPNQRPTLARTQWETGCSH